LITPLSNLLVASNATTRSSGPLMITATEDERAALVSVFVFQHPVNDEELVTRIARGRRNALRVRYFDARLRALNQCELRDGRLHCGRL
jgi:hypothetical protein